MAQFTEQYYWGHVNGDPDRVAKFYKEVKSELPKAWEAYNKLFNERNAGGRHATDEVVGAAYNKWQTLNRLHSLCEEAMSNSRW